MINYLDKSIPTKERIKIHKEEMEKIMNPFTDFNPDDFEPLASEEEKEIRYRKRIIPPKELPTFGLKPKEIRVGQMIGMYENNQDLYLTFAWRTNQLQKEVDELKNEIKELKKNI